MAFGLVKRHLGHIGKVPQMAQDLLPDRGIVLIGGGLMSPGSRAIVDLDSKTIFFARNKGAGSTPYGKLPEEGSISLQGDDLEMVIDLANRVWESDEDFSRMPPIMDFDVIAILVDGDDIKPIKCRGPPLGAVDDLYSFIWKLIQDG